MIFSNFALLSIEALNDVKAYPLVRAIIRARLDFPVPGGPHRINEIGTFCSIICRRGFPSPSNSFCPTISFKLLGLI